MFAHNQTRAGWLVGTRPELPRLSFLARLQETNEPNTPLVVGDRQGYGPVSINLTLDILSYIIFTCTSYRRTLIVID